MNRAKKAVFLFIALLAAPAPAAAQERPQPEAQASPATRLPRHLVMFTHPGPNWARLRDYPREVLITQHRDIYVRLTAAGDIIAGGAFEGEPVLGISIFRQGIDEAAARALLRNDRLFNEGVVAFEFRTLGVQMGSLEGAARR